MGFSPDVEKALRYADQLEQDDKDKLIAELKAQLAEIRKLPEKWREAESKAQWEAAMTGDMCADDLEYELEDKP